MDKQWMKLRDRSALEYLQGIDCFLDFAFTNSSAYEGGQTGTIIKCPCSKCANMYYKTRSQVRFDLLKNGFLQSYVTWDKHGENNSDSSCESEGFVEDDEDMLDMLQVGHGVAGMGLLGSGDTYDDGHNEEAQEPLGEAARFYRLLEDYKEPLVMDGSKVSKLVYIMKLLHLKYLNHRTDTSFTQLLKFQNETLGCNLPSSYDACRKIVSDLGLNYIKIDACPNDCIIYWREHADVQKCPRCDTPRWKTEGENVPHKILRYFPITPKLQRLFMSNKIAKEMRWHIEERSNDENIMRHPADSLAWKSFDEEFKSFADDPRSVRVGLATDGFQPFNNFGGSSHSIWPVVLTPYNLPPWMCMKPPYLFLSLLIDGPNSPGMDLDVYLQPLIEELKGLWEVGVDMYDAYTKQNFVMHGSLLWTISDFPAYADLSGWSTKGFFACPCHKDPPSRPIKNRISYMRHRCGLGMNHRWRKLRPTFYETVEKGSVSVPLSGEDVLLQCSQFNQDSFGKVGKKRKWDETNSLYGWRKKSIFFQLPYWSNLKLRHNLDVMHIEKNVSENIIGTLMNIKGKTKDTLKARLDLVKMGIRQDLHPIVAEDKVRIPVACYILGDEEKSAFCEVFQNLKTPDGYCSNVSRCVKDNGQKVSCMKSHDHHVFMEQLLPIAIRGLLPKNVCEPLFELSSFFRNLCSKNLNMKDLDDLEKQIPYILCKLEMIFRPSFFSVMVHLVVHLVAKAKIADPVRYRWMYPIERYLRTLKSYVHNKAHPEGSIVHGYLAEECLTFCSRYMDVMTTKFQSRNDDGNDEALNISELDIFNPNGRPLGKPTAYHLSSEEFEQVHLYALHNCDELLELVKEHKEILAGESKSQECREKA